MALFNAKEDKKPTSAAKNSKPTESSPPTPAKPYNATDIARELKLPNSAIVRRYLRAAKATKPANGWEWTDRAAAKEALEAVSRAIEAKKPINAG